MGMMVGRGWCWRIGLLGFERRERYLLKTDINLCQCAQSNCKMRMLKRIVASICADLFQRYTTIDILQVKDVYVLFSFPIPFMQTGYLA
jgi:hypothetical protein